MLHVPHVHVNLGSARDSRAGLGALAKTPFLLGNATLCYANTAR
jgi:hypothetical protein